MFVMPSYNSVANVRVSRLWYSEMASRTYHLGLEFLDSAADLAACSFFGGRFFTQPRFIRDQMKTARFAFSRGFNVIHLIQIG
jgi:hypothetical protein